MNNLWRDDYDENLDYADNELCCSGECPACAYTNHEFSLPCGMAYEDDICTVSQDWQLPINGMIIVAPKRHVEVFEEMDKEERVHLFEIVNDVVSILWDNSIAKDFNVLFEEKDGIHFHIWILPRDGWKEKGIDPTKDIRKLMEHSKAEFKNEENYEEILKTTQLLKNKLEQRWGQNLSL